MPTNPRNPAAAHLPLVAELPLVDQPGGTDVDLRTQAIRFIATGALAAVIDFGIYSVLLHFGLELSVAKSISFVVRGSSHPNTDASLTYAMPTA